MGCGASKRVVHGFGFEIPKNEEPDGDSLVLVPSKVREKIWRYLDQASKLVVREVCKDFRNEVNRGSGLTVRVNDYEEGNLDFVKSIEVMEASILHVSDDVFEERQSPNPNANTVFRCIQNIYRLDVWGRVSSLIYSEIVLKCSDTVVEVTFKPLAFVTHYINPNPVETCLPESGFVFHALRSFVIHYGFLDSPFQDLKVYNENMRYLLKTFSCPVLRTFKVVPETTLLHKIIAGEKKLDQRSVRWENHPLKSFINEHRSTLRTLDIVLYRTQNALGIQPYRYPRYLDSYSLAAPCMDPIRPDLIADFWQGMLGAQLGLRHLSVQIQWWFNFLKAFTFLHKSVFVRNSETLREVYIQSYHRKPAVEDLEVQYFMDFSIFSRLLNLHTLHVSVMDATQGRGRRMDLFNALSINDIPRSVRELNIRGILCASDELLYIAKVDFLTSVVLMDVGTSTNNGVSFDVAKAFFTARRLEYIKIRGVNDDTDPRSLYALLVKFNGRVSEVIEVEYPRKKLNCVDYIPCCCCLRAQGEENLNLS